MESLLGKYLNINESDDSLFEVSVPSVDIQTRGTCPGIEKRREEVFFDT
jgi:hypothetical protein